MEENENVVINGIKYVPANSSKSAPTQPASEKDIRICVLERGWVCIGEYEKIGDYRRLSNGAVIRVWGTTKGLPELVNGPTSSTKLDKCEAAIEFSVYAEILTIPVNADAWKCLAE